ncbi:hypothetical protein QL285_056216 [Trifolium repens]|nr:hypothetical protein QL285_056216 [Trifolium repens]
MGSKSVTSITILILSLNIFFVFTTLTSADPDCPDLSSCANVLDCSDSSPQAEPCCSVIGELGEAKAAFCLCDDVLGASDNPRVQAILKRCGLDTSNIPSCGA